MAVTMIDLALKSVIEFSLKTVRANPDKVIPEIFGDYKLDPSAAIYGNRTIAQIKNWVLNTEIPVVLGFDLAAVRLPAVTVHLASTSPSQQYLGDVGQWEAQSLEEQEIEVIVPKFKAAKFEWNIDKTAITLTPDKDMPIEQRELLMPGLKIRDSLNRHYLISADDDGNVLIIEESIEAPLSEISLLELEVVTPVIGARYDRGNMLMDEVATVAVHGHTDRNEGLWLYYIVMWGLLKYRPLMISTFGLDLAVPSASDFSKDDSTMGTNSWRRFIQVSAKSVWTWEAARQRDVVGLLLSINNGRSGNNP